MTLYEDYPTARFFEKQMVRFTQPSALNDPDEALPNLSFGRFTEEDYAVAREKATRKLEAMFMTPFPSRRFDEVSFPGLRPVKELRLRPEPFATTAEFDRGVGERAVELVGEPADRSIGIFSLSRVLNELMRAYYSDSRAGLVVGFNENHPPSPAPASKSNIPTRRSRSRPMTGGFGSSERRSRTRTFQNINSRPFPSNFSFGNGRTGGTNRR
jgi:hypothetical protein